MPSLIRQPQLIAAAAAGLAEINRRWAPHQRYGFPSLSSLASTGSVATAGTFPLPASLASALSSPAGFIQARQTPQTELTLHAGLRRRSRRSLRRTD